MPDQNASPYYLPSNYLCSNLKLLIFLFCMDKEAGGKLCFELIDSPHCLPSNYLCFNLKLLIFLFCMGREAGGKLCFELIDSPHCLPSNYLCFNFNFLGVFLAEKVSVMKLFPSNF